MPMTVYGSPLSEIERPSMFGSLWKRRSQRRSLTSATFGAFGESSAAENGAAADDRHAEQLEVVGGDLAGPELLGHAAAGEVHDVVAVGGDVLDDGWSAPASG